MRGKKSSEESNKVTMFPGASVDLENTVIDDNMDEALRESIKREADELEARLNNNPAMKGIGASDDMFEKIVASLKEMGVWEEDNDLEAGAQVGGEEKKDSEFGMMQKSERESLETEVKIKHKEQKANFKLKITSEMNVLDTESKTKQAIQKKEVKDIEEDNKKASTEEKLELRKNAILKNSNLGIDREDNLNLAKAMDGVGSEQDLEEIYKLLPETDRIAMELGHRVKRENEKKGRRKRKRIKIVKRIGVVAASVVAVFSVSMVSEANRRLVLQAWNEIVGNFGVRMSMNYVDVEKYIERRDEAEYQAVQDICEKLEVSPIYLRYLPNKMKFSNYEIQVEWEQATLFYVYNDTIMTVQIIKNAKDRASYFQLDEATGETEYIESIQEEKVKLQGAESDQEQAYMAQLEKSDYVFIINGIMEYSEMKEIIKNIIIFEN